MLSISDYEDINTKHISRTEQSFISNGEVFKLQTSVYMELELCCFKTRCYLSFSNFGITTTYHSSMSDLPQNSQTHKRRIPAMLTVDEVEAGIKVESDPLLSDTQQACIKRSCFFRHDIFSLDLDALRTHNQI